MSLASLVSEDIETMLHVEVTPLRFAFEHGGLCYDAHYDSQGAVGSLLLRAARLSVE